MMIQQGKPLDPEQDAGSIRTVLALHPLGHSGSFFQRFAEQLGTGWNVLAPNLPGHGSLAEAPPRTFGDFVDVARAATLQLPARCHLLGHSLGGAVAGDLARLMPERFASLTLVASPIEGSDIFAQRAVAVERGGMEAVLPDTLDRWFGKAARPKEAAAALRAMRPEDFDAVWRAFAQFQGFGQVTQPWPPTLVISFEDDTSTPPGMQQRLAEAIRASGAHVQFATVRDAGHMGMMQKLANVTDHFLIHAATHAKAHGGAR